jgi:hypothetical protein
MVETNKGISLVIMILGVIVLMIIGLFVYREFLSSSGEENNINFSQEGNLIINNPGFENNIWYLSYESSGSPTNSAKLSFDKDSVCKSASGSCSNLTIGERVNIKGIRSNEIVLVKELKAITD